MITDTPHGTAKIYTFPQRTSAALATRNLGRPALALAEPRLTPVEFGSGWYHDAAIQAAPRKS